MSWAIADADTLKNIYFCNYVQSNTFTNIMKLSPNKTTPLSVGLSSFLDLNLTSVHVTLGILSFYINNIKITC